jgi:hypothetical protein
MGYELLETVTGLLTAAGLRAGEEYPAGERMEIRSPAAAVGLRELDPVQGTAFFTVRVLSPRMLGGWCCQVWAARAVETLTEAGLTCQTGEMEYVSGSDCFCVVLLVRWPVVRKGESWVPGRGWQILIGERVQEGVVSFRAARSQGRRLLGAFCQAEPVAVTSGRGGWTIELVQHPGREPEEEMEPFTLTVLEGDRKIRYTGCCWNGTVWDRDREGQRLTRQGFALGREETLDG